MKYKWNSLATITKGMFREKRVSIWWNEHLFTQTFAYNCTENHDTGFYCEFYIMPHVFLVFLDVFLDPRTVCHWAWDSGVAFKLPAPSIPLAGSSSCSSFCSVSFQPTMTTPSLAYLVHPFGWVSPQVVNPSPGVPCVIHISWWLPTHLI